MELLMKRSDFKKDLAIRIRSRGINGSLADYSGNDLTRLTKDERGTYDYVIQVTPTITAQIGSVLSTPRQPGVQIDLSFMLFTLGDWKAIDFDGVNFEVSHLHEKQKNRLVINTLFLVVILVY